MKWNTPEQLEELLCEIVSWDSRTGTTGEIEFSSKIKDKLLELKYFEGNRWQIQFMMQEKVEMLSQDFIIAV